MPDTRSPPSPLTHSSIKLADIAGRLAKLRIERAKCGRAGPCSVLTRALTYLAQ